MMAKLMMMVEGEMVAMVSQHTRKERCAGCTENSNKKSK